MFMSPKIHIVTASNKGEKLNKRMKIKILDSGYRGRRQRQGMEEENNSDVSYW